MHPKENKNKTKKTPSNFEGVFLCNHKPIKKNLAEAIFW